ncbi:DNA-binding GntR family transcriptional regulator [Advenella incenata]|uniref:DNA-binding GntR family transcriptional regulator n=1 Tax=Advenella incenata TaxID=267800 RepID=A0A4Q7VFX0_9BURK|nr:GntR family transcriptional regulator [Advenella incenata]RZT94888.1 DNA-binding GntR family transcriptional regulator [Advenella incenata]
MKPTQDSSAPHRAFSFNRHNNRTPSNPAHTGRIAHYLRLAAVFQDIIAKGEWAPGTQLPTLPELCEQYSVSRNTVRQALQLLVDDGLLTSTRGKGTFVQEGTQLSNIPAMQDQQVRLLRRTQQMALPKELASAEEGCQERPISYTRILRMHHLDSEKFNLSDVYVAQNIYTKFPKDADLEAKISDLVRRYAKPRIIRYRQEITIARADLEVAALFDRPVGEVLVRIRRWLTDNNGDLVFAAINLYVGHLFVLNRVDEDPDDVGYRPGLVPDESSSNE